MSVFKDKPLGPGTIKIWTVGGDIFEGTPFVYDTSDELITVTTAEGVCYIDADKVVAYCVTPIVVEPQPIP